MCVLAPGLSLSIIIHSRVKTTFFQKNILCHLWADFYEIYLKTRRILWILFVYLMVIFIKPHFSKQLLSSHFYTNLIIFAPEIFKDYFFILAWFSVRLPLFSYDLKTIFHIFSEKYFMPSLGRFLWNLFEDTQNSLNFICLFDGNFCLHGLCFLVI
jgi:hypothetical protein